MSASEKIEARYEVKQERVDCPEVVGERQVETPKEEVRGRVAD